MRRRDKEVTDKNAIEDIIMQQYTDEAFEYEEALLKSATIIKVAIQSMTGKQSDI